METVWVILTGYEIPQGEIISSAHVIKVIFTSNENNIMVPDGITPRWKFFFKAVM